MKFDSINKTFSYKNGLNVTLLKDISFELFNGEIATVLASVGSGKTTLLKIICGLEEADTKIPSAEKKCFIPSKPSSFPWLNTFENISFTNDSIDKDFAKSLINTVGLVGYENHFAKNKSLGFRFRISLARALAANPELLVIDEPFSEMDQRTKFEMLQLIVDINKKLGTTVLYSTSNISEALLISHRIFLMKKGSTGDLSFKKIEYNTDIINERINSEEYFKYLAEEETLAKSISSNQSFTITL